MQANLSTAPCSPLSARVARHIVTHAERYQHLPQQAQAALFARCLRMLRQHKFAAQHPLRLITNGEGGAA